MTLGWFGLILGSLRISGNPLEPSLTLPNAYTQPNLNHPNPTQIRLTHPNPIPTQSQLKPTQTETQSKLGFKIGFGLVSLEIGQLRKNKMSSLFREN